MPRVNFSRSFTFSPKGKPGFATTYPPGEHTVTSDCAERAVERKAGTIVGAPAEPAPPKA